MLIIRQEQMDGFQRAAMGTYVSEIVAHLAAFSPPLFEAIKEDQLRRAVRLGIAKAGDHGFDLRGPVRLYLELMLLFGSAFDTDPQYPWAGEILRDRESGSQMARAERLHAATLAYRKQVNGPDDVHTLQALRQLAAFARAPLAVSAGDLERSLVREMGRVYPEKTAYVGDEALGRLIDEGVALARAQGFTTLRGVTLTVVLLYAFGHGCFDDPLYPWIARTLVDERIRDAEARANRLESKAVTWLEHVIQHFDGEGRP